MSYCQLPILFSCTNSSSWTSDGQQTSLFPIPRQRQGAAWHGGARDLWLQVFPDPQRRRRISKRQLRRGGGGTHSAGRHQLRLAGRDDNDDDDNDDHDDDDNDDRDDDDGDYNES